MLTEFKITTTPEEGQALIELAALEMRNPSSQLRWLLRQELMNRGLVERSAEFQADETLPEWRETT